MQVAPAMNRQGLRALNAQARRFSRTLSGCSSGCTPAIHPLDGTAGRTGLGKYSGITAALGAALKNDDLIRASQRQDEAPPILRRVSTIAAVVAMAATDRPRDKWYSTIADITTAQTAETVKLLVRKMPVREEDAIAYSLTVVLLTGAVGEKAGERGDTVLAYQKALAAFDMALESIRIRGEMKAKGLSGLGVATNRPPPARPPTRTRTPNGSILKFSEIPSAVGRNIDPATVIRYAVQFVTNGDGYPALTDWSENPPSWITDNEKDSFRLAAFAVGRLPELSKAKGMGWGDPYGTYRFLQGPDLANLSEATLGEWAVAPPAWRRTSNSDIVGSALTYLITGFKKYRGITVCGEDLKTGEDWIIEDCEWNTGVGKDTNANARGKKIDLVKSAWAKAFPGREIDNCTINYYTRLKWCSENTYVTVMREKEAAGRPAPTEADTVRTWENTAAGQAVSQLTEAAKTGAAIISAFLSGNISEGLGLIVKVLGDIGRIASQFLCSAINLIFKDDKGNPTPVGQVLCAIITFLVGGFFDKIRGGFAISKALFEGLGAFFKALGSGDFQAAGKALIDTTNTIVLILLAGNFTTVLGLPMVDQELTADQRAKGYKSIEALAKDLGFDFTVGLIAAGVGFIFTGPTPVNQAALVTALGPAVALVLAPVLKNDPRSPQSIRNAPLETIKKGIQAILKIGALVLTKVMSLQDTFMKFGTALMNYARRVHDDPYLEGEKLKASFSKNFAKQFDEFKVKMSNGNFDEKVAALKGLTSFFPDLIVAIAMDDPDLATMMREGQKIWDEAKKTYEEAKKIWEEAMKAEPNERTRLKDMRAALDKLRIDIDELCKKYPDDVSCQFPTTEKKVFVEKIVEKPVIVEKVVYRDREVSPAADAAQKGVGATPLILGAGGFAVGGPIGAAIGLVAGLVMGARA